VDLNGDGHRDLLSGSWPGELFFCRGGPNHTFAAPEMIRDKDGNIINIGGGITEEPDGSILIRGKAEFERTDEGTFVNYHGKRIESTPEHPIAVTGSASAVAAADWDDDGDHDLIVGDIRGNLHLIPNEGTPQAYAFGKDRQLRADGQPLRARSSRVGPCVADWDGDGDLDLLVGAGDGSVSLYRNVGSAKEPRLAGAEELVPPGEVGSSSRASKEVRRGTRSKICTADWNGDGKLDLLVGDLAYQKPNRPDPTPEEAAEYERIRKEMEPISQRYGQLIQKLRGDARPKTREGQEELYKQLSEVGSKMSELRSKLPREYETHGWVWLFVRK
jgi:hypothetical protein